MVQFVASAFDDTILLTHDRVGVRLDVYNLAWFLLYLYQAPKLPPVEADPECQQTVERVGAGGGNKKNLDFAAGRR